MSRSQNKMQKSYSTTSTAYKGAINLAPYLDKENLQSHIEIGPSCENFISKQNEMWESLCNTKTIEGSQSLIDVESSYVGRNLIKQFKTIDNQVTQSQGKAS